MFVKSYDVMSLDMRRGVVEIQVENGEVIEYPFQFIGIKNTKISQSDVSAMVIGEDRVNAVAILFPKHKLVTKQIEQG